MAARHNIIYTLMCIIIGPIKYALDAIKIICFHEFKTSCYYLLFFVWMMSIYRIQAILVTYIFIKTDIRSYFLIVLFLRLGPQSYTIYYITQVPPQHYIISKNIFYYYHYILLFCILLRIINTTHAVIVAVTTAQVNTAAESTDWT